MGMDEDLIRSYRRWQAAEAALRDNDADAEFQSVFAAAVDPGGVSAGFTAQTMAAIAAAAVRERRRAWRLRAAMVAGGLLAGTTAAYFGAGFLVAFASAALTGLIDLAIGAVVGMAGAAQTGAGLWSVLTSVGGAAATFVADPSVTVMLLALQGIAVAALVALHRLLGLNEESLK